MQLTMAPIILVFSDSRKIGEYIEKYRLDYQISPNFTYEIKPKGKEISIEQIRDIKKEVIYNNLQAQLFILYDFDNSSYEAQNAFLKTLEEHRENIHFLLTVKSYRDLAPTIVSRSKIVLLKSSERFVRDNSFVKKMDIFLKNNSLRILADPSFQAKEYDDSLDLFDKLIDYFRERTVQDKNASFALRKIIRLRTLVQKNNVDPQNALDYLFLQLLDAYREA